MMMAMSHARTINAPNQNTMCGRVWVKVGLQGTMALIALQDLDAIGSPSRIRTYDQVINSHFHAVGGNGKQLVNTRSFFYTLFYT